MKKAQGFIESKAAITIVKISKPLFSGEYFLKTDLRCSGIYLRDFSSGFLSSELVDR